MPPSRRHRSGQKKATIFSTRLQLMVEQAQSTGARRADTNGCPTYAYEAIGELPLSWYGLRLSGTSETTRRKIKVLSARLAGNRGTEPCEKTLLCVHRTRGLCLQVMPLYVVAVTLRPQRSQNELPKNVVFSCVERGRATGSQILVLTSLTQVGWTAHYAFSLHILFA